MKSLLKIFNTGYYSATARLRRDLENGRIKKIALLRGRGIGDYVTFLPVLTKIRAEFPQVEIVWVTSKSPFIKPILQKSSNNIRVIQLDNTSSFWEQLRSLVRLQREKFDVLIISIAPTATRRGRISSAKTPLLSYLTNARYRIGSSRDTFSFLHNIKVNYRGKNPVEISLSCLEPLGIRVTEKDRRPELFTNSREDDESVAEILGRNCVLKQEHLVAFHTGAASGYTSRLWLEERWSTVADKLAHKYGVRIVFIGAAEEKQAIDRICKRMMHTAVNFAGSLQLGQTIDLLNRCRLLVCTNSGPMHIAAALGKPVVALSGPSPKGWDPSSEVATVIRKNNCLRACDERLCELGENICMTAIMVDDVVAAADTWLGKEE
jgi:lipopolysaccharide heptosyltransferase II